MTWNTKVYIGLALPNELKDRISAEGYEVESWHHRTIGNMAPAEELLKKAVGCHGIILTPKHRLTANDMDAIGSQLNVISTLSSGYDHIDMLAARERGITVANTSCASSSGVAEYVIGLLIAMSRRIFQAEKEARRGEWDISLFGFCGNNIGGKIIGIVGFGGIGAAIAKRLVGFEPKKIIYCGPSEKPEASQYNAAHVTFDELIRKADYVIASCSLNETTEGLFNQDSFRKMKPSAVFLNVSRGGVVNHDDLYKALINKTIKAAALDVTTPEPLPVDHPLFTIDNCVILPHIGSATHETRFDMAKLAVENLIAGIDKKPIPQDVVHNH